MVEFSNVSDGENKIININDLYEKIIRKNILELLKVIHLKYPTKFSNAVINEELANIFSNVKLINEAKPIRKPKPTIGMGLVSEFSINSALVNPVPAPDLSIRCQSRIWGDILNKVDNKPVLTIDDKFQVLDYNDININQFTKKYILGKQCTRKKTSNSNYCRLHNRHRPHGNYLELPNKELCLHFMIDGGYINKFKSANE